MIGYIIAMDNRFIVKWLIIAWVSFPLILVLDEVCVRHIGSMRFLFGMTSQEKQPTTQRQSLGVCEPALHLVGQEPIQAFSNCLHDDYSQMASPINTCSTTTIDS
jgi:hypothetical protein